MEHMHILIVFPLLAVMLTGCQGAITTVTCNTEYSDLYINDTAEMGDILVVFNEAGFTIESEPSDCPMRVENDSLVLSTDIRPTKCNERSFRCNMKCGTGGDGVTTLTFTVKRVDLHEPHFPEAVYKTNVSELVPPDTEMFSFEKGGTGAENMDCWNELTYRFVGPHSPFKIVKLSNSNSTVTTAGSVIYDVQNFYNLTVIAEFIESDPSTRTTTTSTTTAILEITVLDVDDKPPLFVNLQHALEIDEETTSSDLLITKPPMLCRDQDVGINKTILYRITDNQYFDIINSSGELVQKGSFDREMISIWETEISCFQEDDPSKQDKAVLQVTVRDINDHLPEFNITSINVSLVENSFTGTYVTTVTATDRDLGENAVMVYGLDQDTNAFHIDNTTGQITINNPSVLDREKVSNISILVYAEDLQGNRSSNNVTIMVSILDMNDNSPVFTQDVYRFYYNTSVVNTAIGNVSATDDDVRGTPNSNITYNILQSWQDNSPGMLPLNVDTITGDIVINGSVMPNSSYSLLVQACDNPVMTEERRCSISRVIALYTLNTTFASISMTMGIIENSAIGSIVGQIPIRGDHYITNSSDFIVDSTSFMLRTNTSLDREVKDEYNITVEVFSDALGPMGVVHVTIHVVDMNDNPPLFDQDEYFFTLPQLHTDNIIVGTIRATDGDTGNNSELVYQVQGSSFSEVLYLDGVNGNITLIEDWWSSTTSLYQLTITVSDLGLPPLQTSTLVYISDMSSDNITSSVKVGTVGEADTIEVNKTHFERELASILNIGRVQIASVESNEQQGRTIRSYINFTGFDFNETEIPLSVLELQRMVVENWTPLQELFRAEVQYIYSTSTSDDGLKTTEIALIVIAGVILIGGILAIIVVYRLWDKYTRNQRLYDSLRRPSTLYDSQEIRMDFGDEHGMTNLNKGKTNKEVEEYEGSFGLGYINTGYVQDDDDPKTPTWSANDTPRIPRWSTSDSLKDAIESLEELTNRLNAEDNISRITSMSRERKSVRSYKSSNDGTPLVDNVVDICRDMKSEDDFITPIVDYPVDDDDCTAETADGGDTDEVADDESNVNAGVYYVSSFRKQCREADETEDKAVIVEATAF